jgi:hypothetical protein
MTRWGDWNSRNLELLAESERLYNGGPSPYAVGKCFKPVELPPSSESERSINAREGSAEHPRVALPLWPRE